MDNRKVAIITGSTKGIGRGIAEELSNNGIHVVITSRNKDVAVDVAESISDKTGIYAKGFEYDISNSIHMEKIVNETISEFGQLDILVNNAITQTAAAPLENSSIELLNSIFISNISHTLALSQTAFPYLKQTQGNIINIGSVITNRYIMGLPFYSIVKASILQMTKSLAAEWAADGVRVNAINPGFIRTSVFEDLGFSEEMIEKSFDFYTQYHPLGKIGEPADIGKLALYLALDTAKLVTGSIMEVDGGYSIKGLANIEI